MTVSEASVGDVIVLTYDVTACMCVHVHASVLVCVPVRVTFCVFLFFLGMLNLIIIYFSFFWTKLGVRLQHSSHCVFISSCNDIFKACRSFKNSLFLRGHHSVSFSCRAMFIKVRTFQAFENVTY